MSVTLTVSSFNVVAYQRITLAVSYALGFSNVTALAPDNQNMGI